MLPLTEPPSNPNLRWFSRHGCVVHHLDHVEVLVGGTVVGKYHPQERGVRNLLMVGLAQEPTIRLGKLAWAFDVSAEQLRRVRRRVERGGIAALPTEGPGGFRGDRKLTPQLRRELHKLFEQGLGVRPAHRRIKRRFEVSHHTVWVVHKEWEAEQQQPEDLSQETTPTPAMEQQRMALEDQESPSEPDRPAPEPTGSAEEQEGGTEHIAAAPVRGGQLVQHVGTWLMLGQAVRHRLYDAVAEVWGARRGAHSVRLAVDAVICALSIGQCCVEGVRRLATPSGGVLLRADQAPSASWVRRVLKRLADDTGAMELHLLIAGFYLGEAQALDEQVTVFYVDNHMRPYTGKHVIRKGWRMQDKRVLPGTTDYYVHDEDGRPVLRVPVASNESLTALLSPIAVLLREGLGEEQRLLLAFDRAGAYAEQLVELRDFGFEFVTYERRPYPLLSPGVFTEQVKLGDEVIEFHERNTNLGRGRGRVRRIALRMEDGYQVNLLAISKAPAQMLIGIMLGRWCQENAFKHGVERWGINQLDGRKVRHYPEGTVIPNPARRKLDNALRLARVEEGMARRDLARLPADDDRRRQRAEKKLAQAMQRQDELEALRPHVPKKAAVEETELAGRLVYHETPYKTVVDTIRIVCANAETDLAYTLAPHLRRPAEAKKALANLLKAPGQVRVKQDHISVVLSPAGTRNEKEAFLAAMDTINGWGLVLPGDTSLRPLRFRSHI